MKRSFLVFCALVAGLPMAAQAQPTQSDSYRQVHDYIRRVSDTSAANRYTRFIIDSATKYHLNPMVVARIIRVESSYKPRTVSHAGAMGLMQVMPVHFRNRNIKGEKRFDPKINIDLGCRIYAYYKKMMQARYPGLDDTQIRHRTLVAYNMGPRFVVHRGIYRSRYSHKVLAK